MKVSDQSRCGVRLPKNATRNSRCVPDDDQLREPSQQNRTRASPKEYVPSACLRSSATRRPAPPRWSLHSGVQEQAGRAKRSRWNWRRVHDTGISGELASRWETSTWTQHKVINAGEFASGSTVKNRQARWRLYRKQPNFTKFSLNDLKISKKRFRCVSDAVSHYGHRTFRRTKKGSNLPEAVRYW